MKNCLLQGHIIVLSVWQMAVSYTHLDVYKRQMWRITDDLWDNWESLRDMFYRCHN